MKKVILIFLVYIVSISCAQSVEIEWKQVDANSYINPAGIMGEEDIYGYSFMLKSFNKGQYEPVLGRSVWYTIAQYTIDCSNMTYKIGMIDSYDSEDNFVNGDYNRYAKFRPIVSETAVSAVASKLCRVK